VPDGCEGTDVVPVENNPLVVLDVLVGLEVFAGTAGTAGVLIIWASMAANGEFAASPCAALAAGLPARSAAAEVVASAFVAKAAT
jgi:hypothetical protein